MVIICKLFGDIALYLDLAVCFDLREGKFHETADHIFDSTSISVNSYQSLRVNIYVEAHLLKVSKLIHILQKLCDH